MSDDADNNRDSDNSNNNNVANKTSVPRRRLTLAVFMNDIGVTRVHQTSYNAATRTLTAEEIALLDKHDKR